MLQKSATYYKQIQQGFPGQIGRSSIATVTDVYEVYDTANPISPGDFVVGNVDNTTKSVKYASLSKGSIDGKPILGVVIENSLKAAAFSRNARIPSGHNITVIKHGAVWIKATAEAKEGDWVYLKKADGSLAFDKLDTKADHFNTRFQVIDGGAKDAMILIERV